VTRELDQIRRRVKRTRVVDDCNRLRFAHVRRARTWKAGH
jgi:hypothetical protein